MIPIECPQCGSQFEVRDSMKGGVTNCQDCGKLLDVPGSDVLDKLFHLGVFGGGLAVVVVGASLIAAGAVVPGIAVIVAGAVFGGLMYVGM